MLRSLVSDNLPRLVLYSPSLLLAYLDHALYDEDHCIQLWHDILTLISASTITDVLPSLQKFLAAADRLPTYLKPLEELDHFTGRLLSESLAGHATSLEACRALFGKPGELIHCPPERDDILTLGARPFYLRRMSGITFPEPHYLIRV